MPGKTYRAEDLQIMRHLERAALFFYYATTISLRRKGPFTKMPRSTIS